MKFIVFESPHEIPNLSVLYTDYEYYVKLMKNRFDVDIIYDSEHKCDMLEKAILKSRNKDIYNEVVVGIDPGRNPCYVVIGDDELIDYGRVSVEELKLVVKRALTCFPSLKTVVRVGGGADGWRTALELKDKLNVNVEVVDEEGTSSSYVGSGKLLLINKFFSNKDVRFDKDLFSALRIALRKGIKA